MTQTIRHILAFPVFAIGAFIVGLSMIIGGTKMKITILTVTREQLKKHNAL